MRGKERIGFIAGAALSLGLLFLAFPAAAGTDDDLRGWVWNDDVGWISMNCVSAGTCGVINYGVDLTADNRLVGYGWSQNVGWMCFGETCGGITPEGLPAYANVDPVTHDAHGWANILTLGAGGWVALNCSDSNPGCLDYAVNINRDIGVVSGWAWNGNADGSGLGWFDFSWASVVTVETNCADGLDGDADGLFDCADPDCLGQPGPGGGICGEEAGLINCTDTIDNDGDGLIDCADPTTCWHVPASGCLNAETPLVNCFDGVDNDFDDGFGNYDNAPLTGVDCLDTDCIGDPNCPVTETICNDEINNDMEGGTDCFDDDCDIQCTGKCETLETQSCLEDDQCPPDINGIQNCIETIFPWIKTFFQDIYSTGEIRAQNPPPQGQVNATYCLLSAAGGVINFRSDPAGGCQEVPPLPAEQVALPRASSGYANILGRLDLAGIRAGTYGPVKIINNLNEVPDILAGKIYLYEGGGEVSTAGPVIWKNGALGISGTGTIVIVGNLRLANDTSYVAAPVSAFSNLASVGWLVLNDESGNNGNISIDPSVNTAAGIFYAEGVVSTGAGANPLRVSGAMVARSFLLERTTIDPVNASEEVRYDGRAGINPPPGLSDITKGLPEIRSTAP